MARRTITEIAERVGVSIATVSRALNNVPGVSEDKRRQILALATELDYHPNAIARSLQGQCTNTVAYVVDMGGGIDPDLFFFKDFIRALAKSCATHTKDLLIHPALATDTQMGAIGSVLRSGRADGLILADVRYDDPRVRYLLERELPFVAFGRSETSTHPCVDVDGAAGIAMATRHVIERGHRRIGFLGLPSEYSCSMHRFAGFQRALEEHSLPYQAEYVAEGLHNDAEAHAAMRRFLALPRPPTAFVAASDTLAIQAMAVAAHHGLHAGRDYAITGFDNLPIAQLAPGLTTLRQPLERIADALIRLLGQVIAGDSEQPQMLIEPELVVRGSS